MKTIESGKLAAKGLLTAKSIKAQRTLDKSVKNKIQLKVLYFLIDARVCTSIVNAAHSKRLNPENVYAFSSENPAIELLYRWKNIDSIDAENAFRNAVGFESINS